MTPPPGGVSIYTIAADNATLMRQAQMTAQNYMMAAIRDIDELLGKGYAESHPELIESGRGVRARDHHAAGRENRTKEAAMTSNQANTEVQRCQRVKS